MQRIRVAAHIGHWCLLVLNRTLYSIPGYLGPHHPHILRLSYIFKWCNHEPKHQIQVHFCFYFKDIVLACFTLQFALALKNLTLSPVWSPLLFVLFCFISRNVLSLLQVTVALYFFLPGMLGYQIFLYLSIYCCHTFFPCLCSFYFVGGSAQNNTNDHAAMSVSKHPPYTPRVGGKKKKKAHARVRCMDSPLGLLCFLLHIVVPNMIQVKCCEHLIRFPWPLDIGRILTWDSHAEVFVFQKKPPSFVLPLQVSSQNAAWSLTAEWNVWFEMSCGMCIHVHWT